MRRIVIFVILIVVVAILSFVYRSQRASKHLLVDPGAREEIEKARRR
jgi:hypothetical protein